jgi:hypothetical protein
VTAVAAALVGAAALALGAYPAQHEGAGKEPTAGGGIFAGSKYAAHSTLVRFEIGASCCPSKTIGDLNVYVFEQSGIDCRHLDNARYKRNFSYTVESNGKKVPVGKPIPGSWFEQASFNERGVTTGFQPGASIFFTRADTAPNALWHGRIALKRVNYEGKIYAWAGTFAARWCGTKKP